MQAEWCINKYLGIRLLLSLVAQKRHQSDLLSLHSEVLLKSVRPSTQVLDLSDLFISIIQCLLVDVA